MKGFVALLVFPVAKSTEILFVNKTIFDRFFSRYWSFYEQSHHLGKDLFDLSDTYYEWSDAGTPDVEGDGKSMFVHDYHFNYFQVGSRVTGDRFFLMGTKSFMILASFLGKYGSLMQGRQVEGGIWLNEGYATEPLEQVSPLSVASFSQCIIL